MNEFRFLNFPGKLFIIFFDILFLTIPRDIKKNYVFFFVLDLKYTQIYLAML